MWCLPSLNRPAQCKEVIERLKKHGCSTPGILFVNTTKDILTDLDPEADEEIERNAAEAKAARMIEEYKSIELPEGWKIIVNDGNFGLCGSMNRVFKEHPNEPFYGMITDDEFIATDGWDKTLIEAAGNLNISHGNNGWQSDRRIHGFMTVGGDLVREIGYMFPQGMWHWYSDDVYEAIAARTGFRRFCRDVKIENRHWMLGNVKKDKTYELSESRNVQDREIFFRWLESDLPAIMKRIMDKMGNPPMVFAL